MAYGIKALVGTIAAVVAIVPAMLTARPLLGSLEQAFRYIQAFSGFVTLGITIVALALAVAVAFAQAPCEGARLITMKASASARRGFDIAAVPIVPILVALYATWQ